MSAIAITKQQARQFLLFYQGLTPHASFTGKKGIMTFIKRVGCIQFDPLNVVGMNPELVLQSRIAHFDRKQLYELIYQDRQLFDYWDKMMSILPMSDWPYFARMRGQYRRWCEANPEVTERVRQEIANRGALCSGDLDDNEKVNWAWGPTRLSRAALEGMYHGGQLVIASKIGTRKYYDLAERVIPKLLHTQPDPFETVEQYYEWYVLRRIGSVGLLWNRPSDAWLGIPGMKTAERHRAFAGLLAKQLIMEVTVEGLAAPLYIRTSDVELLHSSLALAAPAPHASIIAPLDNLLWDRKLIQAIFDFEYRWEVYKPAAERQYGYYVLPVVYGDRMVARFDPVKQKKQAPLAIHNWWWEAGIEPDDEMKRTIIDSLERLAAMLGTSYDPDAFVY
ncbi:hypothetical protein FHS18_003201 [Paenibacillus phyllosphaerae]|uniref:Winged helix-turn-helix domain-containing protein n=1 Tax=Paenibacillus phyllosphaerae TaxID=274593 RepID=A0A7W5FNF6_9BACL|nr:crosslink repair DNA glycosylase YcaQ family protein [Paenibacillus phyllosphaerae]MBB3111133.1 hypothetical protein [Paenibacillus phyllosphaerae]